MTENEAINVLEKPSKHIRMVHKTKNEMEFYTFSSDLVEAFEKAIQALSDIQAYRAIGTVEDLKSMKENGAFSGVELAQIACMQIKLKEYEALGTIEECRTAVERMKPMKPKKDTIWNTMLCPNPSCGNNVAFKEKGASKFKYKHDCCCMCGQAIDWSE